MTKTTRLAAALLTSGLALGAYTTGFAPAGAAGAAVAPQDGDAGIAASTQTFKNERYGLCLDGHDGNVDAHTCGSGDDNEQKWQVHTWGDGTVRLKNVATGECLSDGGGTLGTSASCTTSEYQSFYVTRWDDGTIRFKNEGSGQCVKAAGGGDVGSSRSCDSSEAQSWS